MEGDDEVADEQGWFSVWAQPPPEVASALRCAMDRLRAKYVAPYFDPHVTVLGLSPEKTSARSAAKKLRDACRNNPPFTVRLTRPESGTFFYQCIFMLVDPTQQVLHTHEHVKNTFEYPDSERSYMPHLSLLYADLSAEEKAKAKEIVETEFPHILDTEFLVSSLCLYNTDVNDNTLKSWKKVAEYPLEGNATT